MRRQLDEERGLDGLPLPLGSSLPAVPAGAVASAANPGLMARRWLPIGLALAAAAAGAGGADGLAFYLVLAAVPLTAGCALAALGELLDMRARGPADPEATLQPFLSALALLLLIAGTAAGALAIAVSGCLAVYSVQALIGLAAELRRPAHA